MPLHWTCYVRQYVAEFRQISLCHSDGSATLGSVNALACRSLRATLKRQALCVVHSGTRFQMCNSLVLAVIKA